MLDRLGLTIGTLARRAGSNVPTIRYYEEIGLLPKPGRKPGGHRIYADDDIRRLFFIRRCRDFGFPIEQVRTLLGLMEDPGRDCNEARDLAQLKLETVRHKLTELKALESALVNFVDCCNAACSGGPFADCVILEGLNASKPSGCCS